MWGDIYAKDGKNSFIIPPADPSLHWELRDRQDMLGFYEKLNNEILPLYYDDKAKWNKIVMQSMNDVFPYFDSDRMVTEYYEVMYQ